MVGLALVVGGACSPVPPANTTPEVETNAAPRISDVDAGARDRVSFEEREGELRVSKGNPAVADVLLAHRPIVDRFGKSWMKSALGARIRVRGTLRVHVCGPQEQCLSTGEIPVLTPDVIEVISPAPAPSATATAKAVTSSQTEEQRCLAECKRTSDACDQSAKDNRRELKRCGSRFMTCEDDCRKTISLDD